MIAIMLTLYITTKTSQFYLVLNLQYTSCCDLLCIHFKFSCSCITFGLCLRQDSSFTFFYCAVFAVASSRLAGLCCRVIWLTYCLVTGCRFECLLIQIYCFVLQIDKHHWQNAALNIVFLSSGPAAFSASSTATRGFPTSENDSRSDC
jgi:hypothetical protein